MFIWTRKLQWWQHFSKDSSQKAERVFGQCPIHIWKKLGKNINSKCFHRKVAYNFSNPKKIPIPEKGRNIFDHYRNFRKLVLSQTKNSLTRNVYLDTENAALTTVPKNLAKSWKEFCLMSEKVWLKNLRFPKKSTPSGYLET